jgi:carboxyl-terminal processing protease
MTRPASGRWRAPAVLAAGLDVAMLVGVTLWVSTGAAPAAPAPPPCAAPAAPIAPPSPTTVSTIEQAYRCVFRHYYGGATLADRVLLTGAFAGFTEELARRGLDQPDATMPALSGDRDRDWTAFQATYRRISRRLTVNPALRQALAAATIDGMVAGLHDNHARWSRTVMPPGAGPDDEYGLGLRTSPSAGTASTAPQEALPPLYVTSVAGGPAARAGLRPGDVIELVDGSAPFVDGVLSTGTTKLIYQQYPDDDPVHLTLYRPATRRTWTVSLTPTVFTPEPRATALVTATLVRGDLAEIRLTGFAPGAAGQVRHAIAALRSRTRLRGVILDLRDNGGGSPVEVAKLLGSFTHGKIISYNCDADGTCTALRTDDHMPLLHLPLAVLTGRDCASACDAFSGAVKDLHAGTLIGSRTAGVVSGQANVYLLDDGSTLVLPATHMLSSNHEPIDGIGVAPDDVIPLTARDVSTGRDPELTRAITILDH